MILRTTQILLTIIIITLFYFLFNNIWGPVSFKKEAEERIEATQQSLNDIRTLQLKYLEINDVYCDNFKDLKDFYINGTQNLPRRVFINKSWNNNVPDELIEKYGIERADSIAIAEGNLLVLDSLVAIKDVLKDDLNKDNRKYPFNINKISNIPNTNEEYEIWTGFVKGTRSPGLEVYTEYGTFIEDIDGSEEPFKIGAKEYFYDDIIKIGSRDEKKNYGNWAKSDD